MKVNAVLFLTDGATEIPVKLSAELECYDNGSVMSINKAIIEPPFMYVTIEEDIGKISNPVVKEMMINALIRAARSYIREMSARADAMDDLNFPPLSPAESARG